MNEWDRIPATSPAAIFTLRDSSFAADLFFAAAGHFDFFNRLRETPADFNTICRTFGLQPRPADVLLTLLKSYRLIREEKGIFHVTGTAHDYLTKTSFFDLTSYVNSLKERPVCLEMVKVLKTGQPANWASSKSGGQWAASMEEATFAEAFTAGMNSRGAYLAAGLIPKLDLSPFHAVLDIGGASGIYAAVMMKHFPHLKGGIFEKPPVDKIASYSMAKFGLEKKADVFAGDMFTDRLPEGYDVHFLSHVLHDWDMDNVQTILTNSYESLAPGGMLVLHDAHINRRKTGPRAVAEYSVLLMFSTEGKCYSVNEMEEVLNKTGFSTVTWTPTVMNRSIITARK